MITFRLSRSLTRGVDVVEVWWEDKSQPPRFIATIYPPSDSSDPTALTIVSKYIDAVVLDDTKPPPVAAVVFGLDQ